jgi:hypothetical protein
VHQQERDAQEVHPRDLQVAQTRLLEREREVVATPPARRGPTLAPFPKLAMRCFEPFDGGSERQAPPARERAARGAR